MTSSPSSRTRRPLLVRFAAPVLVASFALGGVLAAVSAAPTEAAPIDDLRAQAQDLESKIYDISSHLSDLFEQTKATQAEIDAAKIDVADAQPGISMAQAKVAVTKDLIKERAATVYKTASSNGVGEFDTDIRKQAARRQYSQATEQRDSQLLAELATAKEDLSAKQAAADKLRTDLQKQQDGLKAQQADFQQQNAQLDTLKAGVTGQIAQLVAQQEAARRAAQAPKPNSNNSGGASTFDPSKIPPVNGRAGVVVAFVQAQLGKPYCYAGIGPDCYDCSGLTMEAWSLLGVGMPHGSEAQHTMFPRVPMDQLQPGDIVWFPGHVGIYVGGGAVIHAPHTGDVVRYTDVSYFQDAVRPG